MTPALKTYLKQMKYISEQILDDKSIQQSYSPEIKRLKENLTDFINIYPNYMRYGLQNNLMNVVANILKYYYNRSSTNRDIQLTTKIFKNYGFEKAKSKYYKELNKFVKGDLLQKIEEFTKNLAQKDQIFRDLLLKWIKELKKCRNDNCVLESYYSIQSILYTPRDNLFYQVNTIVEHHVVRYLKKCYEISRNVLNDPKLLQLNTPLKVNLTRDLQQFLKMYESTTNEDNLNDLHQFFMNNISLKYYDNTKINLKILQEIRSLFNRYGLRKLQLDNDFEFDNFLQYDFTKIFKNFKDSLKAKDLEYEKPILEWYDNFVNLKAMDERKKEFEKLYDLFE